MKAQRLHFNPAPGLRPRPIESPISLLARGEANAFKRAGNPDTPEFPCVSSLRMHRFVASLEKTLGDSFW
jgi:hypothetical protein